MINRYRIACTTCEFTHTLRITLGVDSCQEHVFECYGCGQSIRVSLKIDFDNQIEFHNMPGFKGPRAEFTTKENCELCDKEGLVLNLDPNFPVPDDLIHTDRVFPWMYQVKDLGGFTEKSQKNALPAPYVNDVFTGIGGVRNLKHKILLLKKAWELERSGRFDLSAKNIEELVGDTPLSRVSLNQAILMFIGLFSGEDRRGYLTSLLQYISNVKNRNPSEYEKFRSYYVGKRIDECLIKHLDHLKDFLRAPLKTLIRNNED